MGPAAHRFVGLCFPESGHWVGLGTSLGAVSHHVVGRRTKETTSVVFVAGALV